MVSSHHPQRIRSSRLLGSRQGCKGSACWQVAEDGTLLEVARQVQAELTAAMRIVCKHGNILVLPTLPSPPLSAECAPSSASLRAVHAELPIHARSANSCNTIIYLV